MGVHSGGDKVCKLLILKVGERGRNRTFNLLIKSQLLCQLSYAPACGLRAESITWADSAVSYRTRPMQAATCAVLALWSPISISEAIDSKSMKMLKLGNCRFRKF